MTQATPADWELAIVLPLGVVANQLRRIEAQLRLLNMKSLDLARERDGRIVHGLIEARLEHISEALGSIAGLVADIEADIRPPAKEVTRTFVKDEAERAGSGRPIDNTRSPRDAGGSEPRGRKASADHDD